MSSALELLSCTMTFRNASSRQERVQSTFASADEAVRVWLDVLLHEAREAMREPLAAVPRARYLHPVDVNTDTPGIFDDRESDHVFRARTESLPNVTYDTASVPQPPARQVVECTDVVDEEHRRRVDDDASKELEAYLKATEKKARARQRQQERSAVAKEARRNELPEQREERLREARAKREEARARRAAKGETPKAPPRRVAPTFDEDALLVDDRSIANVWGMEASKKSGGKLVYFAHPLPYHRHLQGLQLCDPSEHIARTLLRGQENDDVECIQGPPGTGKTRRLVSLLRSAEGRVFLCAPTNVGAINLYRECVRQGFQDETSLVLAPDRIPPGTAIYSNNPSRRFVCATVSARCGPRLTAERFENVFLDEAAQCIEATTWILFRGDVLRVVLAGDVRQLPAVVSSSGSRLQHQRSLMERLVDDLGYTNVVRLTEQHRMAPEIVAFPNRAFYDGTLTQGSHAPREGVVEVRCVEGREERTATSFRNLAEVDEVRRLVASMDSRQDVVILTPYLAQCHVLLGQALQCEVHTIDSFQGREAETVVLSIVRDGSAGFGFWEDARRLTVALTRARRRLVVIASNVDAWPDGLLKEFVVSVSAQTTSESGPTL